MEYLLLMAVATVAGRSFFWLVKQTITRRRVGWITAVGIPTVLACYSVFAALASSVNLFRWSAIPGFGFALISGFLFDQDSSLDTGAAESHGRRNPVPLLLWGAGALLYAFAPALTSGAGLGNLLDGLSGAVLVVGGGLLAGLAVSWVQRLVNAQRSGRPIGFTLPIVTSDPRVRRLSGFFAAALAVWLLLPSAGGGAKAPPKSLPARSDKPASHGTVQPQQPTGERPGIPPAPPLGR